MTKQVAPPIDSKSLEIEHDGERLWPPRGEDWPEDLPRFFDWDDGVYVVSSTAALAGPFADLATAIRASQCFDAQVWLDGKVVLRHVEEGGYGSSSKTVKTLRGKYVVLDDIDDSMDGPYRSLEAAIVKRNLFEVGSATTELWCASLSTVDIVSKLTLFDYQPDVDGFISVNGEIVTHEQIFRLRNVDDTEVILKRLPKQLRKAIRSARAESLTHAPPPRSYMESLSRMYAHRRTANVASELRIILRDISGASAAETLARLEQANSTRGWSDVLDLRESMLRTAAVLGGPA